MGQIVIDIHGPQRMNHNDCADSLMLFLEVHYWRDCH